MRIIGLTVEDLLGHLPTDHHLTATPPADREVFTIARPEAFGMDMDAAPVFTDPVHVAAYVRGFIDAQATNDSSSSGKEEN
jgi:hypothetical protein